MFYCMKSNLNNFCSIRTRLPFSERLTLFHHSLSLSPRPLFTHPFIYKYTLRFVNYKYRTAHYNTIEIYIDTAMFDSIGVYCNLVHNIVSHIRWHHSPFDYNIVHPFPNCPDCDPFRNNLAMAVSKRFPYVSVFAAFSALPAIDFF